MLQRLDLRWFVLLALGLTAGTGAAAPAWSTVRVGSETIVRILEEDKDLAVPVYEYLQLDLGSVEPGKLSFHGYGWGRYGLGAAQRFRDDRSVGEFLFGYLQYQDQGTGILARAGRQYVFAGTSNESFDGVRLTAPATRYFQLDGYAGSPVALVENAGRKGDRLYGARIANHFGRLYEVGVSYKTFFDDGDRQGEEVAVDSFLNFDPVSVRGFSSRNVKTDGWKEHSYDVRAAVAKTVALEALFERFQFADFFAAGTKTPAIFRFIRNTDEVVTVVGGEAQWVPTSTFDVRALLRHYDYHRLDETANFASAEGAVHFKGPITVGAEVGRMMSESDFNRYTLLRGYSYAEQKLGFASADVIWVKYAEEILGRDHSFFASLGVGKRFLKNALALRIVADYSADPFFDKDWRGWFGLDYVYGR